MSKAKTDYGLARAILSAPYPLPVIHRPNRDPPARPTITPAPPPPRPSPLPLSFTFPEWDKDWRERGPAFPGVPYPEDCKRRTKKKKKKKTSRGHGTDDGVVQDKQDQHHHEMDDGVLRVKPDTLDHNDPDHHGGDEDVLPEWGGEEGGKVLDVARQISNWSHQSRAEKSHVSLVSIVSSP
jgi:hypothetical protein